MRKLLPLLGVLIAPALSSCMSQPRHEIVETWQAPGNETAFRNIFVVCIEDDERERAELEDAVTARLRAGGVDAVASHRVQPPGGLTVLNMPEVVSGQQADGVLTVEVIDYDERTAVAWAPAVEAGRRDARAVVEAQTVAVQLDSPRAFVQVMLWDARDWEDVWAARSSAFVPHQIADDTDEFADIIAAAVGSSGHVRE